MRILFFALVGLLVCSQAISTAAFAADAPGTPYKSGTSATSEKSLMEFIWIDHAKPALVDGFDRNGLYLIAGSLASVAIAQPFDYAVRDAWIDHQRMPASTTIVFDYMGRGYPGIAIALGQLIFDRPNGIFHSEALITTFFATSILKFSGRLRPDGSDSYSMPSGHSSTMFASATALSYSYGPWVGVPAVVLAIGTAASRWSDNRHWLSDTVAGAALGIVWARSAHFHHFKTDLHDDGKSARWIWTPIMSSEVQGAAVTVEF